MKASTLQQVAFILIVTLSSCFTSHKADKELKAIQDKYPEKVAEYARSKYPCVTVDSSVQIITQDSVVYIDCPDYNPPAQEYGRDTVVIKVPGETKVIRVPVHVPIQYITKTITIRDMADSFHYAKLHAADLTKIGNLEKYNSRKKTWLWVLGSISLLLLLILGFIFLSITKRV